MNPPGSLSWFWDTPRILITLNATAQRTHRMIDLASARTVTVNRSAGQKKMIAHS
jgi:hypothetical protein